MIWKNANWKVSFDMRLEKIKMGEKVLGKKIFIMLIFHLISIFLNFEA